MLCNKKSLGTIPREASHMPQLEKVCKPNEDPAPSKKKKKKSGLSCWPAWVWIPAFLLISCCTFRELTAPQFSHLKMGGMGGYNSICLEGRNKIKMLLFISPLRPSNLSDGRVQRTIVGRIRHLCSSHGCWRWLSKAPASTSILLFRSQPHSSRH